MTILSDAPEINIVSFIRKFTILRKAGRYFRGKCPFRVGEELGETLIVDRKNNRFHCKSCGEKGDMVDFAMKIYGIERERAIKILNDGGIAPTERFMKRFNLKLT